MTFLFTLLRLRNKFCFCLRIKSSVLTILSIASFVSLSMTIGVLTVYFTSPKPNKTCQPIFKRIGKSSISLSSRPRSIAAGDFNNDNLIDIVVANSGTNNIGILLSNMNGTFSNQQTYPTGIYSRTYSVVVNDFNNDNSLDIAVANYGTNNIGIFVGYGNGSFASQKLFPTGSSRPLFIATDDFNKDNRSDIAVANYGTDSVGIFLGYGNGSFHMQIMYSTGYDSLAFSLAVADFNNDDRLDIAVANYGTGNIGILLGYGNGSFSNQQIYTTTYGSNPSSIAVGDINNDNHLDIVVVNNGTSNVGVLLGFGNGTFSAQTTYSIDSSFRPQYIAIGHFDEDGELDVVVDDSENDQIHILSIYDNNTFTSVTTYDAISGSRPFFINVADLNDDNQSDIVVVNYGTNDVLVLTGYTSVPSARQNYISAYGYRPSSIVISDFDNDSHLDIAITHTTNGVLLLMGCGNGTFLEGNTFLTGDGSTPQQLCGNDLNNDNRIDIISANSGTDSAGVLLGEDNGNFAPVMIYSTGIGSSPSRLAIADVNNDNQLDIITANYGTDSVGILLGYGDGNFVTVVTYSTGIGSGPFSVAIGDANNDNYLDIVTADYTSNCISILFGDGNGTFGILSIYSVGDISGPLSIAVADFNSDNYLDIVIANFDAGNVGILLGSSNGIFRTQMTYSTGSGSSPSYVMIHDFNHDKRLDIAITLLGNGEVVIFFGYGNGSFELSRTYFTRYGSEPYDIVVANVNNDNQSKIVVTLPGIGEIVVLTEYLAAQFANQTTYSTGSTSQPSSIAIGDLNNDNRSDIVIANSGTDNLGIAFGFGNGTFESQMMYWTGINSQPQYVIIGDINKDNHLDMISVNSELDSISVIMGYGNGTFADQIIYPIGNGSHPSAVVLGDFNNDNRSDLVVVNADTPSIAMLFGYDYLLFGSQRIYQSANNLAPRAIVTSDFNNDSYLDIAAAFFDSGTVGILLGYGNGSFGVVMTYSQWIGSQLTALAVDDINNDSQLDIVIADYGTNNVIILFGYGNGSFVTSMAFSTGHDSGPSAVTIADFNRDDRLDIAVTNCGATDNYVGILLGHGNGSFATIVTYPTGYRSCPVAINASDFNKDDRLDIVVVNRDTRNIGIFLGYGNGSFANPVTYTTGPHSLSQSVIVIDMDSDGKLDIVVVISNDNAIGYFQGNGDGTFGIMRETTSASLSGPQYIAAGDFNNDNQLDMIIINSIGGSVIIFFGYGNGSFYYGRPYLTGIGSGPIALAIGDFNNDNRSDFAVANYASNDIGIFLGYGNEPFGDLVTYPFSSGSQPRAAAIGDLNDDGLLDVIITDYSKNYVGIVLGNGYGSFHTMIPYATGIGSAPCSVAVGDFNNDNHLDIVVANCETDNLVIFLVFGNGTFTTRATYSTGSRSQPQSIVVADLNNDNRMDIVVANSGTNNILLLYGYGNGTFGNEEWHPLGYDYRPSSIAVNDLNQDGWMDIVIACYNTDNVEILMKMC